MPELPSVLHPRPATRIAGTLLVAIAATSASPAFGVRVAYGATNAEQSQAEDLARRATVEFKAGFFEEAAKLFMRAYAKSGKAALVFNAARAYEQAGNLGEAIGLFRLYLSLSKDPNGIVDARDRLKALEDRQAGRTTKLPPTKPDLPAVPQRNIDGQRSEPVPAAQSGPGQVVPAVTAVHDTAPSRTVAWVLTATGLGIGLAGGIMMAAGASGSASANQMTARDTAGYIKYSTAWDDAQRKWQIGAALGVVGIATAGVAVWLHLRSSPQAAGSAQGLEPIWIAGGAGLGWRASW